MAIMKAAALLLASLFSIARFLPAVAFAAAAFYAALRRSSSLRLMYARNSTAQSAMYALLSIRWALAFAVRAAIITCRADKGMSATSMSSLETELKTLLQHHNDQRQWQLMHACMHAEPV